MSFLNLTLRTTAAIATLTLVSCGSDGGSSSAELDPAAVEASLEKRLEEPGLNELVVESLSCPSSLPSSQGASFECEVEAAKADGVGDRSGSLELTQEDEAGRRFRVEGQLEGSGGTNEYRIELVTEPSAAE